MDLNLFKYYSLKRFKIISALIISTITLLFMSLIFFQEVELKFLDLKFQYWGSDALPDSNVVIVSIDDGSLDYFSDNGVSWPWPRSFYGHILNYLHAQGAQNIVFDMLFSHPDADRSYADAAETDSIFALALERAPGSILGLALEEACIEKPLRGSYPFSFKDLLSEELDSCAEMPIPTLLLAARGAGHTNILPDLDGIFRRVEPFALVGSTLVPSLATATYTDHQGIDAVSYRKSGWHVGEAEIPLTNNRFQLINWYGPGGPEGVFKYFPFSTVIQSASARLNGGTPSIPDGTFKDKIVIIGADAAGLRDLKATPLMKNCMHPGMEVWATVISNLRQGHFINTVPELLLYVILIFMTYIVLLSFDRLRARIAFSIMFAQLLLYLALSYVLWGFSTSIDLMLMPAFIGTSLSYLIVISNEMRERLFLKKVFGPYVAPELMDLMYKTREVPALGGEQVSGSAFFSDLQGFTTFSEQLTPTDLVALLNEYLTSMTDTLMDHRGTLDKYEGDAIIAFFGAPVHDETHAIQAVHAAIHMQNGLAELRKKWAGEGDKWPDSIKQIQMRIGVNSGDMLVGNVGSEGRMNYTMMGDTVNVAARLESSAKQYGVLTQISEATALLMPGNIALRKLGATQLVGKTSPAVSYEVLGFQDELSQADQELLTLWPQAMEAIDHQNWDEAIRILTKTAALERVYAHRPTNPSRVYLDIRIPFWRLQPGSEDWKAVWILDAK